MILHHIDICRQGSDVPTDERRQRVATFVGEQRGEAIDSAGRIADAFVRMFNGLPTVTSLGVAKMYHETPPTFLIATEQGRKIAYIHVVTERQD